MNRYFPTRTWTQGGRYFRNIKTPKVDLSYEPVTTRIIPLTSPGIGREFSPVPVPLGVRWRIVGCKMDLLTSAAANDRVFFVMWRYAGSGTDILHFFGRAQPPSTQFFYSGSGSGESHDTDAPGAGRFVQLALAPFVGDFGLELGFFTRNLDAGDLWASGIVIVEETDLLAANASVERVGGV